MYAACAGLHMNIRNALQEQQGWQCEWCACCGCHLVSLVLSILIQRCPLACLDCLCLSACLQRLRWTLGSSN